MTVQDEVEYEIENGFIKNIVDKILRGITEIENAEPYLKQRWVWELLQNAKDVENKFGKVSIEIILREDSLEFKHNGNPFSVKNITNLIQQVSSKQFDKSNDDKQTGKFGTGFITTHILSNVIEVSGVVQNKDQQEHKKINNFRLDRSGKDADEIGSKIKDALRILKDESSMQTQSDYEESRKETDLDTIFKYNFDKSGLASAKIGIDYLESAIPFTLAFIPKIKSISIHNHIKGCFITYKRKNDNIDNTGTIIEVIEIEKISNNQIEIIKIAVLSNQNTSIAIEVEEKENKIFLKATEKVPFIFCSFPLVGTETFYFPVVINNSKFLSTDARDWIFLLNPDSSDVQNNKAIFEEVVSLTKVFIDFAIENNWQHLYLLAFTRLPEHIEKIDKEWYVSAIQKELRTKLLKSEIVNTNIGRTTLESVLFPHYQGQEKLELFWDICNDFIGSKMPIKEDISIWNKIINNDYEKWGIKFKYELETLLKDIENEKTLTTLAQNKFSNDETNAIEWLNKVINFVTNQAEDTKLLDAIGIIPNQNGEFKKKQELHFDNGIPQELKDILEPYGNWKYTNILIHNQIKGFETQQPKSIKDISTKINDLIRVIIDKKLTESTFKVFYNLITFLPDDTNSERNQLLKFAHAIYPDKVSKKPVFLSSLNDFNFSTCNEWILKALVEDIRETKNITSLHQLNEEFKSKTENEVIEWIDNFICFVTDFESGKHKYLLENNAIIPNQNNNFRTKKTIKKDDNIPNDLKEIANSEHIKQDWNDRLLHKDLSNTSKIFDKDDTKSITDIANEINSAIRDYKGDKQNKNFAELIFMLNESETVNSKEHKKLFSDFHSKRDSLIVGTLGEGEELSNVAKIIQHRDKLSILASIASDISTKHLQDFAKISQSVNISKIIELAKEEENIETEKQFHTKLGTEVEKIFELIDIEGFKIDRNEIGQDYDLKDINKGINIHIEIKSISKNKNFVKMTKSQGKKATQNPDNYVLCVLPKDTLIPTENYFLTNAKFVKNIGYLLEEKMIEANNFEQKNFEQANQDIKLDFEKEDYKFRIDKKIWENGLSWDEFKQSIKV